MTAFKAEVQVTDIIIVDGVDRSEAEQEAIKEACELFDCEDFQVKVVNIKEVG